MITIATLLWDATDASYSFSRAYDETWVEKLYRGFARNLSDSFRFVCYTDRPRDFSEPIEQRQIIGEPSYASCIQPFGEEGPTILVGLDTIVTGSCAALAGYATGSNIVLALPRDPYQPLRACNGVCLIPPGQTHIAKLHEGQNDMIWLRQFPHVFIDDLFPGQVVSYKCHVREHGLGDARIVYFHGGEKPGQLSDSWIAEHWR